MMPDATRRHSLLRDEIQLPVRARHHKAPATPEATFSKLHADAVVGVRRLEDILIRVFESVKLEVKRDVRHLVCGLAGYWVTMLCPPDSAIVLC